MFNLNKRLEKLKENSFRGINEKDAAGCTILHRAVQVSEPEVIKLLIEKEAKTNIENKSGETPLHLAAFYGKVENVKVLLEKGADVNARNGKRNTAVFMREIGNVRAILEAGGDVNAKDQEGYTPLHIACKTGETKEIIKELVKAGANIEQKDKFGKTAMYYARTEELLEKLRELSERTVDAILSLDLEVEKELEDMDEKIKELSVREGSKRLAIGKIGEIKPKFKRKREKLTTAGGRFNRLSI